MHQELSKTGDRHVNVVALLECKVRLVIMYNTSVIIYALIALVFKHRVVSLL